MRIIIKIKKISEKESLVTMFKLKFQCVLLAFLSWTVVEGLFAIIAAIRICKL